LDFSFDTDIVVEAEIWLKPGEKTFGGYGFELPVIEGNNYPVRLQEPKFLGYYYMHFAASKLPSTFWQRIPLLLIASLTSGEIEPPGATILEVSKSAVIYRIRNFEKEVIIPAIFVDFLKARNPAVSQMRSSSLKWLSYAFRLRLLATQIGLFHMFIIG
jgi:hypothetical protein